MPIEVVRSEEAVRTGVQRRAYERVVVRTKVVNAEVTVTVPIRRQVLEIQQIRLHDDDPVAGAPGDVGPDVIEVVLHEERPVVEVVGVEVVPVERVRVIRESHQVHVPVSATVGREEVDIVTDVGKTPPAGPATGPVGTADPAGGPQPAS